jgi:hypothetical protein
VLASISNVDQVFAFKARNPVVPHAAMANHVGLGHSMGDFEEFLDQVVALRYEALSQPVSSPPQAQAKANAQARNSFLPRKGLRVHFSPTNEATTPKETAKRSVCQQFELNRKTGSDCLRARTL